MTKYDNKIEKEEYFKEYKWVTIDVGFD